MSSQDTARAARARRADAAQVRAAEVRDRLARLMFAANESGISVPELLNRIDPAAYAHVEAAIDAVLRWQEEAKRVAREAIGP